MLAAYYKLKDDITDSRFFKRLGCRLLMPFFKHQRKKALKYGYNHLDTLFNEMLCSQQKAEQDPDCPLDLAADPTAQLLAKVFSEEAQSDAQKRIFYEFGYNIGRWIYYADAADDIEKDRKHGNFNPFVKCSKADDKPYINMVLSQSLARAYDAYNLIDFVDFKGIIDNMLTKGLPIVQDKITALAMEEVNE